MLARIGVAATVAFIILCLVTDPAGSVGSVEHALHAISSAGHSLNHFVKGL